MHAARGAVYFQPYKSKHVTKAAFLADTRKSKRLIRTLLDWLATVCLAETFPAMLRGCCGHRF